MSLAETCAASDGLEAICGPVASEDIARIPGTHWLIASGLNVGSPAHLYLIDTRRRQARVLSVVQKPAIGGCTPPQPDRMSLDGLNIRPASQGEPAMLLAANHGDRHAIEMFRIDLQPEPALTWVGCVRMPRATLANAVVPLSDGGMLVTSFHDPDDGEAWNRMDRAERTGGVWEWHAQRGWNLLTTEGVAGANGLEISADERTLYVSAWAAQQLLIINRASGAQRVVRLDFRPDNVHRTADGMLLIAGQRAAVRNIAACGPSCPQPWIVARFAPASGTVATLVQGRGSETINYACGAMELDGTLFITLRGAPRIAWTRVPGGARQGTGLPADAR